MSDKSAPKKNPAQREDSVLGSLPSTRPTRMSRRAADGSSRAAKPAATTAAKPKAATTKPKPVKPKPAASKPRPKAAPKPPPREPVEPEPPRRSGPPSGPELVTTAVQAIGELAQIGVTLGGQALRRAVRRIPRP